MARRDAVAILPCDRQAANLVPFIIEKDEPRNRTRAIDRLAVEDARVHPVFARQHKAQCAVRIDYVQTLDGELVHFCGVGASRNALTARTTRTSELDVA